MEFPGVFKKGHVQIPGVNKKINGISIGLSFDLGISKVCHTI